MASKITKAWLVDTLERVGFTAAEAGLGWLTTYLANLPPVYIVLFATALAALKAQVAKILPETVSPASFAPAQQPGQAMQDAPPAPAKKTAKKTTARKRRGDAGVVTLEGILVALVILAAAIWLGAAVHPLFFLLLLLLVLVVLA